MSDAPTTRRRFIQSSATAAAGATAALNLTAATTAYAAGKGTLKVGLVGCGGRGTGAIQNAMNADDDVQLVALGDLFLDQAQGTLRTVKRNYKDPAKAKKVAKNVNLYYGWDAYKRVIDDVDVVCMATTPHFRPMMLKYAVDQGKHSFVEKPVATDPVHLRAIWDTCQEAKKKNLAVVSGLCWRYHYPKVETMKRVLDGQIGDIVSIETIYNAGTLWHKGRGDKWSDMEYQIRNWLYFTWLSGDHIVEQAIHSLDKMGWALKEKEPARCWGVGGRQVRTDPKYGNVYDHFSLVYEFDNGIRGYHQCRQMSGTASRVRDYIYGTKGIADIFGHRIEGEKPWRYPRRGKKNNMYQTEHDEMFASIRAGKSINNGEYMCKSTMLAIMGRTAAYTGQIIDWKKLWNSKQNLAPPKYELGPLAERPVAMPGRTAFI